MTVEGNRNENRDLRLKLQKAMARIAELEAGQKPAAKSASSYSTKEATHEKKVDTGKGYS